MFNTKNREKHCEFNVFSGFLMAKIAYYFPFLGHYFKVGSKAEKE